jgi:hypothetical protein
MTPDHQRGVIAGILGERAATEEEFILWMKLIPALEDDNILELGAFLSDELEILSQGPEGDIDHYLSRYVTFRSQLVALLEKWPTAHADVSSLCLEIVALLSVDDVGLPEQEAEIVFEDDEKMAEFFANLSIPQLEAFKKRVEDMELTDGLTEEVRSVMKDMIVEMQKDRLELERELHDKVVESSEHLTHIMQLTSMLDDVQRMQEQLHV